jgi:hypothetical protein
MFRYTIEYTEPFFTEADTDHTFSRKAYLRILRDIKEDETECGEDYKIKTTMKLINGIKGELP